MTRIIRFLKFAVLLAGIYLPSLAQAGWTRIEQTHPTVTYSGPWQTVNGSAVSGGSVAAANAAGASVTVDFTGTGIAWIGYRCSCTGGTARIYLDGVLQTTVDNYAETRQPQTEIYRLSNLANTAHELTIEVTGAHHAGEGTYIAVDAFEIDDGTPAQVIEENSAAVTYVGNWTEVLDPSLSGGSGRISRGYGDIARVRFTGTGIVWIGYRCPCVAGAAEVSVDGNFVSLVTSYADYREARAPVYRIEGLPYGEHTLSIYGTGSTTGSNPWIAVDAFHVLNGSIVGVDNERPTVDMTAPAPQALVTGVVTLSANAADNVGVARVLFFASYRGEFVMIGEARTAPYSIERDVSGFASGTYFSLFARAVDAAGNVGHDYSGPSIRVQHEDREYPVVTMTAPAAGSTVSGTINISAAATDNAGISTVEFWRPFCCWNFVSSDSNAPYSISFDTRTLLDGPHSFGALTRDTADNMAQSAPPVIVNVDNSVQPGMVRVHDDNPAIVYSAGWSTNNYMGGDQEPMFHWNSATQSASEGATATLSFDGIGVRWIGYGCDQCGHADVSIDGGPPQRVQLGGNEMGRPGNIARVVYSSPALTNGTHTIRITVAYDGAPNANLVIVDGFEVLKQQ